jgi:hypothetical protein
MKNLLIIAVSVGIVFFSSCEKEQVLKPRETEQPKKEEPTQKVEEPSPIGAWRSTRQYFKLEVDGPLKLKQQLEQEVDKDITDASLSYQLIFGKNGKGSGSRIRYGNNGRRGFTFDWELTEENAISLVETGENYIGVFDQYDWQVTERVYWKMEELTTDKMVLSTVDFLLVDGELDGIPIPWSETHTYRYTFERQKPGEESIKSYIDPARHTYLGNWRSTHRFYSRTADEMAPEEIRKETFMETADEFRSYALVFYENGKGTGSLDVGGTVSSHYFRWYPGRDYVLLQSDIYDIQSYWTLSHPSGVGAGDWYLEESSPRTMVLAKRERRWMGNPEVTGGWNETHTYRFTFEKVE